ncbi:MAG: hypothetical protein IKN55_12860, partial [Oscillospiraceae bacterium]|nr:hypothetical protein [Oscillospiraceae bacterium]
MDALLVIIHLLQWIVNALQGSETFIKIRPLRTTRSGIDSDARAYAQQHGIPIKEFLPDYKRYGRGAPLKRNLLIIEYADVVLAFW